MATKRGPRVDVTVDPRGRRALDKLRDSLLNIRGAEQNAAERILKKARTNATSRPTPQARMVAAGMTARRGVVIGFAGRRVFGRGAEQGVRMGLISFGAEFGSSTTRQFGPRREEGYWLHPAADRNPEMDEVLEDHVDDAIDAAIRVSKVGI